MSIDTKPGISEKEAGLLSDKLFGVAGTVISLPGERDQNFLIDPGTAPRYVLKISNSKENTEFIKAQADLISVLSQRGCKSPVVLKGTDGEILQKATISDGESHICWMVTYLEGKPLGSLKFHPDKLLQDIGSEAGRFDSAMTKIDNPLFHRIFDWDLCRFDETVTKYLHLVTVPELKQFVEDTLSYYKQLVVPESEGLRKSVIHGDINDYNVIVSSDDNYISSFKLSGIIDFGDSIYSYTIANLAVTIAYAILDKPDPLRAAIEVVRGYTKEYKVLPVEVVVLHTLVMARLSLSICMAAYQQSLRPNDKYLTISQKPILRSIKKIESIGLDMAEESYRLAAGLPQNDRYDQVVRFLKSSGSKSFPILGKKLSQDNCLILDLSVNGDLVDGDPKSNRETNISGRIEEKLRSAGKEIGVGRYNEPRTLYTSPLFNSELFTGKEDRTIHLGIDLFNSAGTPVYAPYDGEVYSLTYNPDPLDYGNLIILKHIGIVTFYTLYGHLSSESLKGKRIGDRVEAGEAFALFGKPSENGGWTPHLHFQLISDLRIVTSDFPGVCSPGEREAWMVLSPDPNLLLGIPAQLFPEDKSSSEETYRKRLDLTGKNLSIGYTRHIKMARGWMQYMFDSDGLKYLDGYNNVPHVGHCNPEVIDAAVSQMKRLNTNTRYLYDSINEYAELLLSTFPESLERCYFLNSASEANELALRLAFSYTDNQDVVVLEGAYHGNTNSLIDISPYKHNGPGGKGAPAWVHTAPQADCYRGEFGYDDPEAGVKYGAKIESIIATLNSKGRGVAAFIAETCPSVGGQIIFPKGYLSEVYRHIRAAGGVCIADEVQTGYGRTGKSFYAFSEQGVTPDIVVLGKPIGNGHPIGAVITTKRIADSFDNGMEFFSTFGGNSVSAAVGKKVLEITLRDKLQDHSQKVGNYLLESLRSLKSEFPIIGDVRGSGLFIGVELVKSHKTLEPASAEASWICNRMRDNRILIGTDGPKHNVLKIRPPIPFTIEDADILADRLEKILKERAMF